jgi:ADP-dependent NAD(P)H-hydrate dehydratase
MKLDDQTDAPLPLLPPRKPDSNKGDFGRALVVGGSRGMCGAIGMAGLATLRSGAGLVTLAVPLSVQDVVAGYCPCFMTHGLREAVGKLTPEAAEDALAFGNNADVFALGPGLGRSEALTKFAVRLYERVTQPMVVDADALFALAEQKPAIEKPAGPRVLTPHPGEFKRLTGELPDAARRIPAAAGLAQRDKTGNTVVVLKGHETVITDGKRVALNKTGNPGMATGGSGDVLTGIITALVCQKLPPFEAARLGVHVHGLAGDIAAAELGEVSMIATDLIEFLPKAFQRIAK